MYWILPGIIIVYFWLVLVQFSFNCYYSIFLFTSLCSLNHQSNLTVHFRPLPLTQPEHSNVCFWYIPPSLRGLPPGPDRDTRLHQVSTELDSGSSGQVQWWSGATSNKEKRFALLMVILTLYVSVGGSLDQRQDDGEGLCTDWLSAFGRQSEFLQVCVLQSCHRARRRWLSAGRDFPARPWPMTSDSVWSRLILVHVISKERSASAYETVFVLCHLALVHRFCTITSSYTLQPRESQWGVKLDGVIFFFYI